MSVYSKIGSAAIDALQDTHQESLEVWEAVSQNFWAICNKWARLAETEVGGWVKLQTEWWTCVVWLPTVSKTGSEKLSKVTEDQSTFTEPTLQRGATQQAITQQPPLAASRYQGQEASRLTNGLKMVPYVELNSEQKLDAKPILNAQQTKRAIILDRTLTAKDLDAETRAFQGTGGTSEHSQSHGFTPAFLDTQTGIIHPCCQANGKPAVMHLLDGLPGELVLKRSPSGRVLTAKGSLIAGFIKDNRFYTREEAAEEIMESNENINTIV